MNTASLLARVVALADAAMVAFPDDLNEALSQIDDLPVMDRDTPQ